MFHDIPVPIQKRMAYLEELDKEHRSSGAPDDVRLKQVPRETGKFLAIMASLAPAGTYLEIGTSAGYSALWISLACRLLGRKLVTIEVLEGKVQLARETFRTSGVEDIVQLIAGDGKERIDDHNAIAFCFLDAEKDVYAECYEKIVPKMVKDGILVCDNVLSHKEILKGMVEHALGDERVDAMVVPIGSGELVCVKR